MKKTRVAALALGLAVTAGLVGCTVPVPTTTTPAPTATTVPATTTTAAVPTTTTMTTAPPATTTSTAALPTTATTPTPPTTTTPPQPQGNAPAGYMMVSDTTYHARFAVPAGMIVVDSNALATDPSMRDKLNQLAQTSRLSPELFEQLMSMYALVAGDTNENSIGLAMPAGGRVPTAAEVTPVLTQGGATGITCREVTTSLGQGLVASYTLNQAGVTPPQAQLYFPDGDMLTGTIQVTGATWTADQVTEIVDVIAATLAAA